jgi:signal transduction histidine kinase
MRSSATSRNTATEADAPGGPGWVRFGPASGTSDRPEPALSRFLLIGPFPGCDNIRNGQARPRVVAAIGLRRSLSLPSRRSCDRSVGSHRDPPPSSEPGGRTMGEADYFDRKTLADDPMAASDPKRAGEDLQRHTAQLQGLASASLAINSARSADKVSQAVTEVARHIIGAHLSGTGFSIYPTWAQAIQSVSLSEKYAAWRDYDEPPDGSGIYALVCETNHPMRLAQAELEAHPRWRGFGKEAGRHPPLRGFLAAPHIASDGRNMGLVAVSDKYEGEFTEDDEAILVQLAQVASIAIENAWLYEEVRSGHEHMQVLSRQLLEVQEAERGHLARELHDEVGQLLTGLRLLLKPNTDLPTDAVETKYEQARSIVDELLERIRGLSFDLRPAALDQLGLLPALIALFERYTEQTGVTVKFKHDGVEERFPPQVETTAYRIVQEALTNVARHAGVGDVTVRVWANADVLSVQIEDRGCGFDPEVALATPRSSGLAGMRERVMLLDGHLTIESRLGAGMQLTAELPLRGQSRR